jgi:two-component system, NarL family, sensor histidine kinase ComP
MMWKRNIMRAVVIFFVIYQIWALFIVFRYPVIGINLEQDSSGHWIIKSLDEGNIVQNTDIRAGDRIISINGGEPDAHPFVHLWHTMDQVDEFVVDRDGILLEVRVWDMPLLSVYDTISYLAEFFSLVLAVIIYKRIRNLPSAVYLSAVFLDIAFIFMSLATSIRGAPSGKFFITTFMMLMPALFLHFFNAFLQEKGSYGLPNGLIRGYLYVIALPVVLNALTCFTTMHTVELYLFGKISTLVISGLGVIGCLALLIRSYVKHRKEKSPLAFIVKSVFWALFCSVAPVILLSFTPRVLLGYELVNSLLMSCFIFIFPLTFVYLLATRRLYDIDLISRRMYFTTAIAFLPSLLFMGLIKLLFDETATGEQLALVFFILLTGTSFILYSLENLTAKLEPTLFPRKYRLQMALKKISRNLGMISSFQEMREIILKDIAETLEVRGAAIMLHSLSEIEMITVGSVDEKLAERLIEENLPENGPYTCFEITRQEGFTAYLIVTEKNTGTILGLEEVNWLQLILTYLAVSLENVQLIRMLDNKIQTLSSLVPKEEDAENIRWFRKLMFSLQEKERVRIAMDIHDSTMQDLFFLKRRLQTIHSQHMLSPEGQSSLDAAADFIDMINAGLRQSCFELHPYILRDIGLVEALNKLFHVERTTAEFKIEFSATGIQLIEEQGLEVKQHLFRMIQELLNNAKKYSRASEIGFLLQYREGCIELDYSDDGVGFEERQPAVREVGSSGQGLEQLKSRVLSLDGSYELSTSPGKGVRFNAQIPVTAS